MRWHISRPRLQHNGVLIYPNRGKPPLVPDGYIRDKGDPFILVPIIEPCKYRQSKTVKKGNCQCNEYLVHYCTLFDRSGLAQCVGCEDRVEEGFLNKATTYFEAMLKHNIVDSEIMQKRLEKCKDCDQLENSKCKLCSCPVRVLAKHVENLPKWGCKHPQRGEQYGWPI